MNHQFFPLRIASLPDIVVEIKLFDLFYKKTITFLGSEMNLYVYLSYRLADSFGPIVELS